MSETFPEVMNVEEVCQYLRIPRSSLYKLAQEGKIPCQKVGRHWRFRKETIDRWLDKGEAIPDRPNRSHLTEFAEAKREDRNSMYPSNNQ